MLVGVEGDGFTLATKIGLQRLKMPIEMIASELPKRSKN
jgi:hypothetical protein